MTAFRYSCLSDIVVGAVRHVANMLLLYVIADDAKAGMLYRTNPRSVLRRSCIAGPAPNFYASVRLFARAALSSVLIAIPAVDIHR